MGFQTDSYKIRNVYNFIKLVFDDPKPILDLKRGIVTFFKNKASCVFLVINIIKNNETL